MTKKKAKRPEELIEAHKKFGEILAKFGLDKDYVFTIAKKKTPKPVTYLPDRYPINVSFSALDRVLNIKHKVDPSVPAHLIGDWLIREVLHKYKGKSFRRRPAATDSVSKRIFFANNAAIDISSLVKNKKSKAGKSRVNRSRKHARAKN